MNQERERVRLRARVAGHGGDGGLRLKKKGGVEKIREGERVDLRSNAHKLGCMKKKIYLDMTSTPRWQDFMG